jgi:predicted amidohydrolase YtcJ
MYSFQGNIKFGNGRVVEVSYVPGGVAVEIDNKKYNFQNAWLYPGFVDAHGHLTALGERCKSLDLSKCTSASECVQLAAKNKNRRGEWFTAGGWNNELWNDKALPDKKILDLAFPDIPVSFVRVDGHALWVNSRALELAGINKDTPEPPGGAIICDDSGVPNGILLDNAMNLVSRLIPDFSDNQIEDFILTANDKLVQAGITSVHDMDVSPGQLRILKKLEENGHLKVNIFAYVQAQDDQWIRNDIKPYKGTNLNIIGVKFYADGALGSYGAALLEPYSDKPDTNGLLLLSEKELFEKAKVAIENGFDIATHAIGDKANKLVINVYKKLREKGIANRNTVLRIEHTQIIQTDDIAELKKYGIIASVQPVHCISDAQMARKRLGNRVSNAYPWRKLQENGVILAAGSDFPIENHSVLLGLDAFVNRIPFGETRPWLPELSLSVKSALKAYTINPRIATRTIGLNKDVVLSDFTDFTILDRNLMTVPGDDISRAKVLATIVNGEIVYHHSA